MNEITADIGLLKRQVRDVQSVAANIQHHVRQLREPSHALHRAGGLAARHAVCAMHGFIDKRGAEAVAKQMFGGDHDLARLVERSASPPASTTGSAWATELVAVAVADILTNVLPQSVLSQLRAASGMEFLFVDGAIVRTPLHALTPNGTFIAEGGPIPVAQLLLSSVSLPPKKIASIIAMTRELLSGTPVNVEVAFKTLLAQDMGLATDAILLDANAADAIRPAGLLAGLSPQTAATTGTPAEKIAADVRALFGAIAPALTPLLIVPTVESAVLDVAAPGLPKITSVSLAAGTVIAIDASQFVSAIGPVDFHVSSDPAVHAESAPSAISAPGTPNVVAAPVTSLWQTGALGMRAIVPANWQMRRVNAVAFMNAVGW